jgi:hypothetical protein
LGIGRCALFGNLGAAELAGFVAESLGCKIPL